MSDWCMAFSFALFFTAVYRDNSSLAQYEDVSILIDGERLNTDTIVRKNTQGSDTANRYVRGWRPIAKNKISALLEIGEEGVESRIHNSGLYDKQIGAQCLHRLLLSDHVRMEDSIRERMLEIPYETEPERFLAQALLQAVRCPKSEMSIISDEIMVDILAYRQIPDDIGENGQIIISGEDEKNPTANSEDTGTHELGKEAWRFYAAYDCREIQYSEERDTFKNQYLVIDDCNHSYPLSDEEKRNGADRFRKADATYLIRFEANVAGLADILLHRVRTQQCTMIALAVKMRNLSAYNALRDVLTPCVEYALVKDGLLLTTYGYDDTMEEDEYSGNLILALKDGARERILHDILWHNWGNEGHSKSRRTVEDYFPAPFGNK